MWERLPTNQKDEYKILLLSFSAMTELFAQKNSKSKKSAVFCNETEIDQHNEELLEYSTQTIYVVFQ